MKPLRGHAKLAIVLAACAVVAVGGVIAAFVISRHGHKSAAPLPIAPTTGSWTPLSVRPPKLPTGGAGIPVDVDPRLTRTDFSTTLSPLGTHRYGMTIINTSDLGVINSLQWYPPTGVHVLDVVGSTKGHCTAKGVAGYGVNQTSFLCDDLDLKPPSCTCLGDGDSMTVTFVTDKAVAYGEGDLRVRAATLAFDRIPTYQQTSSSPGTPQIMRIVTRGRGAVGSGGLTAREREDAQSVLDGLQKSNISFQLVAISRWVQSIPAACRVRPVPQSPGTYQVYVFWVPALATNPYVWLDMNVTKDARKGTFDLGTAQSVPAAGSVDTALLSRYGSEQARKGRELMVAHGGGAFGKPGAACQVLKNGSLRLLPTG
jgi:hypothetical protein